MITINSYYWISLLLMIQSQNKIFNWIVIMIYYDMKLKSFHPQFVWWTFHVSGLAVPRIAISMDVMCASKQVILACPLGRKKTSWRRLWLFQWGIQALAMDVLTCFNGKIDQLEVWMGNIRTRYGVRELRESSKWCALSDHLLPFAKWKVVITMI